MPTCLRLAVVGSTGYGADVLMTLDGSAFLSPRVMASVFVPDSGNTDIAGCAAVSISGAEYLALTEASTGTPQTPNYPAWNELGSLSIADAQVISGYVGLLWAGVWGIKQVIKSLSISERNQDE